MKSLFLAVIVFMSFYPGTAFGQGGPDPVGMFCFKYEDQECCDYATGMTIECSFQGEELWPCHGEPAVGWNPVIQIAVSGIEFFTGGQYMNPDRNCKCKYYAPICGDTPDNCLLSTSLTTYTTWWQEPLFNSPCHP